MDGDNRIDSFSPSPAALLLQNEYQHRLKKNPHFSLRAFARFLGVAPGTLSEIFSGKRALTETLAERLASRRSWKESDRKAFLSQVSKEERVRQKTRTLKQMGKLPIDYACVEEDEFALIADWYHFSLLALSETESFRADPDWLAERLGLSIREIKSALSRLERLGLIEFLNGISFRPTKRQLCTRSEISSHAIKTFHKQSLSRAQEKLEEVPVNYRDITSMTMAIDTAKLSVAKELIQNFRRQMAALLEEGPKDDVFQLNIQLIPVTVKRP